MTSYILQPPDQHDFPGLLHAYYKTELLINSDTILQKLSHSTTSQIIFPGLNVPLYEPLMNWSHDQFMES